MPKENAVETIDLDGNETAKLVGTKRINGK